MGAPAAPCTQISPRGHQRVQRSFALVASRTDLSFSRSLPFARRIGFGAGRGAVEGRHWSPDQHRLGLLSQHERTASQWLGGAWERYPIVTTLAPFGFPLRRAALLWSTVAW